MTTTAPSRESRRQRLLEDYEASTTKLLSALALVYLVTFSLQVIVYEPQQQWYQWATWFGLFLWFLFVLDLVFRFAVSPHRLVFIRRNMLDIVTVVIPQLRALRALRAFSSGGVLSKGKGALSGRAVAMAAVGTALIVWVGSLMVLSAERGAQGAEITSFPDSLWWSFETITTVGYGDFVPVTWLGRFFAVFIMLLGISVLGVVSASLAATLVKQNQPATPSQDDVLREIAELKQMIADLQRQLPARSTS
ncbi:MAG: two pore domain potassium channel family protein [Actinomycetales bacterium]|nr:two pore domain potassium channel family protein [Actinomycetales bacterium]